MVTFTLDDSRTCESAQVYPGDLGLFQDERGGISIRVVEANNTTMLFNYNQILGRLTAEQEDGEISPVKTQIHSKPNPLAGARAVFSTRCPVNSSPD